MLDDSGSLRLGWKDERSLFQTKSQNERLLNNNRLKVDHLYLRLELIESIILREKNQIYRIKDRSYSVSLAS